MKEATELTEKDLDILLEAVDFWPNRKQAGELLCGLFSAMISKTPEDAQKLNKELEEENKKERMAEEKEIATLIKAKLIGMKKDIAKSFAQNVAEEFKS